MIYIYVYTCVYHIYIYIHTCISAGIDGMTPTSLSVPETPMDFNMFP